MKLLSITLSLLCLSFAGAAQVYTFKPNYSVKLTYGGGDMGELWFEKVDKTPNAIFTVDIDNKTITVPDYSTPKPVTKITRDEENNIIILKIKGDKEIGQVWCYYEMKLDNEGKLIYIQSVERLTGKRFSEDTFFHMYTTDLRTLSFSRKCTSVKSNMALSEDKETRDKEVNAIFDAKSSEGDNTLEMRNGYINWTEGSGRKAKKRQLRVDSVGIVSEDGMKGVLLKCPGDGGRYEILYISTKRRLDPSQFSWSRFITIDKYENGRRKWKMVMR